MEPNFFFLFQTLIEIDKWGIDIFRIGELSNNRPLTAVAFQVFQVSKKSNNYLLILMFKDN